METLEARSVPAHLSVLSAPDLATSGAARGTLGPDAGSSPDPSTLVWKADALVSPPPGTTPQDNYFAHGTFGLSGDLVVQVVADPGDTPGTPVQVQVDASGNVMWDLDPAAPPWDNNWTTNAVSLTAGPAGQAPWFDLQGGQPDPNAHEWATDSDPGSGSSVIDTTIGGSFHVAISAAGESDTWVGGSGDYHGEVEATLALNMSFAPPTVDLVAASLTWHKTSVPLTPQDPSLAGSHSTGGGVDFTYDVVGGPVPQDTTVGFYWGSGPTPLEPLDQPLFSLTVPAGLAPNDVGYTNQITASDLMGPDGTALPPPGTTTLLALVDPL